MPVPRYTLLPLPDHQLSFRVDGTERLRWHFGPQYPRPFFYPVVGPVSGESLTRMGHPGAPDHDHHRSVWFAHEKVSGVNFWSDVTTARVRQKQWLAYQDGDDEAVMAVRLGWNDGHDPKDLLEQDLFAAVIPGPERETFVEIQTSFRPTAEQLEFGKTNFGFFAVRVAKALSVFFGGGVLTSSAGSIGEPAIFGKPATWMDYSGEQAGHKEGITYFDHPNEPRSSIGVACPRGRLDGRISLLRQPTDDDEERTADAPLPAPRPPRCTRCETGRRGVRGIQQTATVRVGQGTGQAHGICGSTSSEVTLLGVSASGMVSPNAPSQEIQGPRRSNRSAIGRKATFESSGKIGRRQRVCPSVGRLALVEPGASTLMSLAHQSEYIRR
jgi:hypothetical protein